MVPSRTPREVVQRLNAAVNAALATEEVRSRLAGMGARPTGGSVEEYQRHLRAEVALWTQVVRESGATAE